MENNWTKSFELSGKEKEEALKKCYAVLEGWKIKMPNVEPIVLDFGLSVFRRTGLIEFWIANEEKEGYCGKFLFLFDEQTCPAHHHDFKHETFFIVKGKVLMKTVEKEFLMKEGDAFAMNQGVVHSFTGEGNSLVLEASKPCISGDSIFKNKRIGENGKI